MGKKIIAVFSIVLTIAALLGVYYTFREQPQPYKNGFTDDGSIQMTGKNVTIEVVSSDGESKIYEITTHADFLQDVMDEAEGLTYVTNDGMVMVVNGVRADYVLDGAYWAFYVNGGYCNYGIADQPVNDKDNFKIEYTKA